MNIEIISASAGSGKTTRLAREIRDAIVAGKARPEAVMAMTFTNKAAAELQERVRTTLLEEGLVPEAQRLLGARIGTINALCGRLASDFAFELGISPDVEVVDETSAEKLLETALAAVLSEERLQTLADLEDRLGGWQYGKPDSYTLWGDAIRAIMSLSRANRVVGKGLESSLARSKKEFFSHFLPEVEESGEVLDKRLKSAMEGCLRESAGKNLLPRDLGALELVENCLSALNRRGFLPWADWARLTKVGGTKAFDSLFVPVREAAGEHDRHPRLKADIEAFLDSVFEVAGLALEEFQNRKRAMGVIDFTDQKVLALDLLERKDVREQLSDELDLVVVDEFQDTDPLELAIFLKLAALSPHNVWVGDPKQSIYGFKGADPDLMLEVLGRLCSRKKPEILDRSFRSRPTLVTLVSEVFSKAMGPFGIPESQIRLKPVRGEEAKALGPAVEFWQWNCRIKAQDADCLAAGIRELVDGGDVQVNIGDARPRKVSWGDVAVLSRTNNDCGLLAEALGRIGIPARIRRAGLLGTVEAILLLNGLRLWVDERDVQAAATLARLCEFPADGTAWFDTLMESPGMEAFQDLPTIRKIRDARAANLIAGPMLAFDLVSEAVGVREWCLAFGDAGARLGNLDALRATVAVFVGTCLKEGRGVTVSGLLPFWSELTSNGEDQITNPGGGDAVSLVTWHSAKGLEWPIVILSDLKDASAPSLFGAQVVSDGKRLNLDDPLAARWIRFFPWPFGQQRKNLSMVEREEAHPGFAERKARDAFEALRLFYVGWTRARDRLIFAARNGEFQGKGFALLGDADDLEFVAENTAKWGGFEFTFRMRDLQPREPVSRKVEAGVSFVPPGPREWPPAWIRPSDEAEPRGKVVQVHELGRAITVHGKPDPVNLGNAVHGFFACDQITFPMKKRLATAERLLARWDVPGALSPDDLVAAADRLWSWLENSYPNATWHREWPFQHRQPNGSIVAGQIDLLGLQSKPRQGILLDHKTNRVSGPTDIRETTCSYRYQMEKYISSIKTSTGLGEVLVFLHFPLASSLVVLDLV